MEDHLFRHQLEGPAHFRHGNTAEIDHADHVRDADLFIFPEDLFSLVWRGEDGKLFFSDIVEVGDFRPGGPVSFEKRADALIVRTA